MAKKAELEATFARYADLCRLADAAEVERDFPAVLAAATDSLPLLRDALAYQRKYLDRDRPPLPTAVAILRYAPPLFAADRLVRLGEWVQARNKAEKAAYPELPAQLDEAWRAMTAAAGLWTAVHAGAVADGPAVEVWLAAGLVARTGRSRLVPVTDLGRESEGKCSGCGRTHRAAAAALLEPLPCPHCHQRREFVFTRRLV